MAAPADLVTELRQLERECSNYLQDTELTQRQRWELLRRVVEDAGKQFIAMRIDALEERQRTDEGAPLWFSVVMIVVVAAIPMEAITVAFFQKLAGSAEVLVDLTNRKLRRQVVAYQSSFARDVHLTEEAFEKALFRVTSAREALQAKIRRTEEKIVKFAEIYEPEVHHGLALMAHLLAEHAGEHFLFAKHQPKPKKKNTSQTDAPFVLVTQMMHQWIDAIVQVENTARRQIRDEIGDLVEIAAAKNPAKEAKAREKQAAKKEAEREPSIPKQRPLEPLPRTSKDAVKELASLRDHLRDELASIEKRSDPVAKDLRALQLMTESIMWATTFDFTPIPLRPSLMQPRPVAVFVEPPLPEGLWKRLIERYIDPDAGESYKDVGTIQRLGTVEEPSQSGRFHTAEVRLAHFFSQILLPKVTQENNEVQKRLGSLGL
jgi:hypothetical protein